jgi:hypothetical protein
MSTKFRELCPNCIDMTEVTREIEVVREAPLFKVERTKVYCQSCNQELSNTVTIKFKHKMG